MPSASQPEFFIDRSLGRHLVPDALREAGVVVHVMADVYGERIGQGLADEEWLHDVGERGWVVLMKDAKIRYRPADLGVIIDHGLRAFCLTNANLRGAEMAALDREPARILRVAQEPGPYICGVYARAFDVCGRGPGSVGVRRPADRLLDVPLPHRRSWRRRKRAPPRTRR